MTSLLLSSAWGLVVLCSFAALGRMISCALHLEGERHFFLAASWGMAGMAVLGGILNLLGVASSSVLITFVLATIFLDLVYEKRSFLGIGELLSSPDPVSRPLPAGRGNWICVVLLVLLVAFKYISSYGHPFPLKDDRAGYLIHLARLLQTGSVGLDPFSEHQLHSLNGQTFLVALLVSATSLKYAFLFDPGICWIMIGGLTWSLTYRDFRGSIRESCLLTSLVLMVATPYVQNLGGHLTGGVLYLSLILTAHSRARDGEDLDGASILLAGLTLAGLCALKTTFLGFGALFLVIWSALRMFHRPRYALIKELSLIALIAFALLLPWMWQQYRSAGTLLYPFLGRGYSVRGRNLSNLQNLIAAIGKSVKAALHLLLLGEVVPVVAALVLWAQNPPRENLARWLVFLASLAGALVGAIMITFFLSTNDPATRYSQPFLYTALIPVGLLGFFSARTSWKGLGLALCLALYVGNLWEDVYVTVSYLRRSLHGELGLVFGDREQIRKAQASIPAGERILVSLKDAFLVDFSRNPIWHFNHPGMVSPPPGLPVPADRSALDELLIERTAELPPAAPSEPLVRYLRLVGVDYLIFQRRSARRRLVDRDP